MPNGPDVSEVCTARGRATKVLPLTNCNAKWGRCQRGVHCEGSGNKGPSAYELQCRMGQMSARCARCGVGRLWSCYLRTAMPNGPDVSEVCTARGGVTIVLPLTNCNAEWARCQRGVHSEGWHNYGPSTYELQCRIGQMSARCARRGVGQLWSFHLRAAMPNGPDVSEVCTARGGVTMVLPLTSCNAELARC